MMKNKVIERVRNKSLTNKILLICAAMLVLNGLAISIYTIISTIYVTTVLAEGQVKTSIELLDNTVNDRLAYAQSFSELISQDDNVANALNTSDNAKLSTTIKSLITGSYKAFITDTNGNIIASTSDTTPVGTTLNSTFMTSAVSGSAASGFYGIGNEGFSAVSASAINLNGSVSSIAIVAAPLTETDLIDGVKGEGTTEYTVFEGNTRVNTTILKNGARFTGTQMNSNVEQTVLRDGKNFTLKTDINGGEYITYYEPLKNRDGTIVGALFAGYPTNSINSIAITNSIAVIGVCFVMISICVLLGKGILNKSLSGQLKKIVNAANQIATGEISDDMLDDMNSIDNNNEIGLLADSMVGALNSIKGIENDISMINTAIEAGDLTVSADPEKHTGLYKTITIIVNNLSDQLRDVMDSVARISTEIDCGAVQVSEASQGLADGTTTQAGSLQEIAANIASISDEIKTTATKSAQTDEVAEAAQSDVEIGNQRMKELVSAMGEIEKSSQQIEKIIKTIEDIAFQTNILSLNAVVEAARAGEAGKGFAVVADEVRNLANKSAEAVSSTSLLISNSLAAIENGSRIVSETEAALASVIGKTKQIGEYVDSIAGATRLQSDTISEINAGIEQISNVVQTTSATAEETAASSEELAKQSQLLKEMVSRYRIE